MTAPARPTVEGAVALQAEIRETIVESAREFEPATIERRQLATIGPVPANVTSGGDVRLHDYALRILRDGGLADDGAATMMRPHRLRYGMRLRRRSIENAGHPQDWLIVDRFTGFLRDPDSDCPTPDIDDGYEIAQDPASDFDSADGDPLGVASMKITTTAQPAVWQLFTEPDSTELTRVRDTGKGTTPGSGYDPVQTGTNIAVGGKARKVHGFRRFIAIEFVRDAGVRKSTLAARPQWSRGFPLDPGGQAWDVNGRNNEEFMGFKAGTVKLQDVAVRPLHVEHDLVQVVFATDRYAWLSQTAKVTEAGFPEMEANATEGFRASTALWYQDHPNLHDNSDLLGLFSQRQLDYLNLIGAAW